MPIALDHVKHVTARAFAEGAYRRLKGLERVAIFIRQIPLEAGTELPIGRKKYRIDQESYLVYVDLQHDANFAHSVLYELHNVNDGKVTTIEEQFPITDPSIEKSLIPHILPEEGRK
jgi:hypothetical protein